tara:strand:+ start:1749 stop:2339 length:591 start_codon:yes stop_codon:yes gene_type:complete
MKKKLIIGISVTICLLVGATSCGSDDDTSSSSEGNQESVESSSQAESSESASAVEEQESSESASAVEEQESSASSGEEEVVTPITAEGQAAMDAFALVYDSNANWAEKAPHLENSDLLEASNEGYRAGSEGLGGITLRPSGVTVDGDTATIIYDVLFGENAAYESLDRVINRIDGVWVVSQEDYCSFLSSARTPCS